MYKIAVVITSVMLSGCVTGMKTGPLSDPEVLAQRCAEANLAITLAVVVNKNKNSEKINNVREIVNSTCRAGVITDYPSALNAISNALLMLNK